MVFNKITDENLNHLGSNGPIDLSKYYVGSDLSLHEKTGWRNVLKFISEWLFCKWLGTDPNVSFSESSVLSSLRNLHMSNSAQKWVDLNKYNEISSTAFKENINKIHDCYCDNYYTHNKDDLLKLSRGMLNRSLKLLAKNAPLSILG